MKKIFLLPILAGVFILFSCNQAAKEPAESTPADTTKKEEPKAAANVVYPYTAAYSSSLEIGDPENTKKVLQLWRDYEDNKLSEGRSSFADTVTFEFGDGSKFRGSADSALAMATKDRSSFASITDSLVAFTCLRTTDKKDNWVLIWGTEYRTDKKGKKMNREIHEGWLLQNGKVSYVFQYSKPKK